MKPVPASFALLLAMALPLRAADPSVSTTYDVPYASPGGADLQLDIAAPAMGDGPFPAVLVIHGGAWREGGKEENHRLLHDFARRGYVAVSPEYRFCPAHTFPAQVEDVKAAVRFLRANAKSLKVDPDRIGAMGFSAGGNLALMLGVTGPDDGLEGPAAGRGAPSSRVQAVVDFFGPIDLASSGFSEVARGYVACYAGATAGAPAKASPLAYVSKDDPPVLAFHGTRDEVVPLAQAMTLAEKLSSAGVAGRVELIVGAGHGWQGAEWDRSLKETFDFFDEHLKRRPR